MNFKSSTLIVAGIVACMLSVGCGSNTSTDSTTKPANAESQVSKVTTVTDKQITLQEPGGPVTATYTGEEVDGKPNGKGTVKGVDNNGYEWIYEGEMKDGQINGQGRKITGKIYVEEGIFENNTLLKGKVSEEGQVLYEGDFKDTWPARPTVGLNQIISFGGWDYTVTSTRLSTVAGRMSTARQFILVTFEVRNSRAGLGTFAGMLEPVLIDSQHRHYEIDWKATSSLFEANASTETGAVQFSNPGGVIHPGTGRIYRVVLVFDVPKNATKLKVIPKNGLYDATYIEIGNAQ